MINKPLQENTIVELKVLRQSDMGSFLDGGTGNTDDDILLHKGQQKGDVVLGDVVRVFLYRDPKKRLTASMNLPKLKVGQIAYTEVVNTTNFGCFVDVGTERGIFMPHAEMRGRPQIGEKVWIRLYEDKSGRLAVSMNVDDAMRRASKAATDVKIGDSINGAIYNITSDGAFLITPNRYIVFIHRDEMPQVPRVGQRVEGRVTFVREDGRLNGSLRKVKEDALDPDMDMILSYLKERNGRMPYGDKTEPQIVKERFKISKAAFKRALGGLMKKGLIKQEDGWTILLNVEK